MVARPIYEIAAEIKKLWTKPYFGAVPYIQAMQMINGPADMFGCDSAKTIIIYFLSNATTWRGEDAKRIKAELKKLVGVK